MSNIENYLTDIKIPQPVQARISEIMAIGEKFLNDEIREIYVSEYINQTEREFESVWMFTEQYMSEAKNFRAENNLDVINLKAKFSYVNIKFEKYSFIEQYADDDSRMILNATSHAEGITCVFKGSGQNCNYLHKIFDKYFRI